MPAKQGKLRGSLTTEEDMDTLRPIAESVAFTPLELAAWYQHQLDHAAKHAATLLAAMEKYEKEKREVDAPYWFLRARLDRALQLIEDLKACGHVRVCDVHGVRGLDLSAEQIAALAVRHVLTGEWPRAWSHRCETCCEEGLRARAAKLAAGLCESPVAARNEAWAGIDIGSPEEGKA